MTFGVAIEYFSLLRNPCERKISSSDGCPAGNVKMEPRVRKNRGAAAAAAGRAA